MKPHENFFSVKAEDNFKFGVLMGEKFGGAARKAINQNIGKPDWPLRRRRAEDQLKATEKFFPRYTEEMREYAKGAGTDFLDLWAISLEDEICEPGNKCTTVITNKGKLISHNEDWEKDSEDRVCLLFKKIGKLAVFELYYINTLGGNAISINSHGFVISVNSLAGDYKNTGVPRNVIARWLSETKDPEADFAKLQKIPRSFGFNFNIAGGKGKIWSIEYDSRGAVLACPLSPYVHTNHYLSELRVRETNDNSEGSFDRYKTASSKVRSAMAVSELIDLADDKSRGNVLSIMNERTIAKMIVDMENSNIKVWLRRENGRGWVDYKLDKFF